MPKEDGYQTQLNYIFIYIYARVCVCGYVFGVMVSMGINKIFMDVNRYEDRWACIYSNMIIVYNMYQYKLTHSIISIYIECCFIFYKFLIFLFVPFSRVQESLRLRHNLHDSLDNFLLSLHTYSTYQGWTGTHSKRFISFRAIHLIQVIQTLSCRFARIIWNHLPTSLPLICIQTYL